MLGDEPIQMTRKPLILESHRDLQIDGMNEFLRRKVVCNHNTVLILLQCTVKELNRSAMKLILFWNGQVLNHPKILNGKIRIENFRPECRSHKAESFLDLKRIV